MSDPILSHERVATAQPAHWLYVLHGMFGAGRNWATVGRRIARARPDWGVVLVDLRQHGASQDFPPPHTIEAAADDVLKLADGTGEAVGAVVGHSFGGKVALALALHPPPTLRQVWVVDSTPAAGEPGGSAWEMLGIVRRLPEQFATRDEGIDALVANGVAPPTAQWMGTNLVPAEDGFRWRFDPDALDALLRDFFRTDLWPVVERPPENVSIHFVKATESSVLAPAAVARVEAANGPVHVHRVTGGHWLNADNPGALVELLVRALPVEG